MKVQQPYRTVFSTEKLSPDKIAAVHEIVDRHSLGLAYQPIFSPKSGTVFGYEALARPPAGLFENTPQLFEAAAQAGRIGELGRLHREMAVKDAPGAPLFLNVNPHEFEYGWLVRPDDPLFRHRESVVLELTESAPLSHFELCRDVLSELRKKGVQLAIDDLGAGYSNLRYISDLAPDFVKLDRELVKGIRDGSRQYRLLESLIRLCQSLRARVIAEGIETVEELLAAQHAGIDLCQGYLLGVPDLPARNDVWPAFR